MNTSITGFEHLKGLVVKDEKVTKRQPAAEKTPTGLTVRLFKSGKVYPSKELVEKFSLEYQPNVEGTYPGCGFDILDSAEWAPFKSGTRMLFLSPVDRSRARVDLFGMCKYNEDLTPMVTVMNQGSVSKDLLNLAKSIGLMTETDKWVDLTLLIDYGVKTQDGIAFVPKTISKGKNVGKRDYERRENTTFYPVTVTGRGSAVVEGENSTTDSEDILQDATMNH